MTHSEKIYLPLNKVVHVVLKIWFKSFEKTIDSKSHNLQVISLDLAHNNDFFNKQSTYKYN